MYNLVFLTFVFFTVNGLHVFFEMGGEVLQFETLWKPQIIKRMGTFKRKW